MINAIVWALSPFLLAFLLAAIAEPVILRAVTGLKMPRRAAALIVTLALTGLFCAIVWLIVSRALSEGGRLLRQLPELMTKLPDMGRSISLRLEMIIAAAPSETQEFLRASLGKILSDGVSVPGELYAWLGNFITGAAAFLPNAMLFVTTLMIAVYFVSADYPRITLFFKAQIPARLRGGAGRTMREMSRAMSRWLVAQAALASITAAVTVTTLLCMRVNYALLMTVLIVLADILPLLGSGLVLIPWVAVCLVSGEIPVAIALLLLWLALTLMRSICEPKFVGDKLGLHPLVSLISIYFGFQFLGVLGAFVFPFGASLLVMLNARGYLPLWKNLPKNQKMPSRCKKTPQK